MLNLKNKRILIMNSRIAKYPCNKGVLFPLEDNIAYIIMYRDILKNKYIRIYITTPFIDGISIKTNAGIISDEEKDEFYSLIKHNSHLSRNGYMTDYQIKCVPMNNKKRMKCGYRWHFVIQFQNIPSPVHLFFDPFQEGARYLKFKFSLKKLGREGWKAFSNWFNENIPHWTFEQFLLEKSSIGDLEIAVDCIGFDINDLFYHGAYTGKEIQWRQKGNLETLYLRNQPGRPSTIKVYDKSKQCTDVGEKLPYETNLPIMRLELTVQTKHSMGNLRKLKTTLFKNLPFSAFFCSNDNLPCSKPHALNCKDAIIARGSKRIMRRFSLKQRKLYSSYFLGQQIRFLGKYDNANFWKAAWEKSLYDSGINSK